MGHALDIALWTAGSAWTLFALLAAIANTRVPDLPERTEGAESGDGPVVSIVLAARDEAGRIAETVRRALAQRGAAVEVIAVDDRSSDGTGAALAAVARENPALRVVRIDALPEGWLGKCNALRAGTELARGRWLLFTDADTWMQPLTVARAVAAAEAAGADHVCVIPGFASASFWGKATLGGFSMALMSLAGAVNLDLPFGYAGVGAFNLIRREAYDRIGGHEALRMEVVDDMKLGMLVRRAGMRTRFYMGARDVEVEWGATPAGMLAVLKKNHFAGTGFSVARASAVILLGALLYLLGALGWTAWRPAGWGATAGWLLTAVPASLFGRRHGWGVLPALAAPLAIVMMVASLVWSMASTLRAGGVRWRDTFYPLAELRRGLVK